MPTWKSVCVAAIVLAFSPWALAAPQPAPEQMSPQEAAQRTTAFLEAAAAFTRDVRLNAGGLKAVLENIDSLNSLKDDEAGGELAERAYSNGRYDFDVVLSDPDYVAWCGSHGLDPRGFFQDLMRLQMLVARKESESAIAQARTALPEQRRQLESLRSTLGEEGYKQSLAALEASQAQLESMSAAVRELPVPTPGEQKLIDANRDRIEEALRGSEDERPFEGPGPGE